MTNNLGSIVSGVAGLCLSALLLIATLAPVPAAAADGARAPVPCLDAGAGVASRCPVHAA